MTWIKICGTTNLDDALLAVDAGADAVGFVFYDKSPRNVTPEAAREIISALPDSIEKIGVFISEYTSPVDTFLQTGLSGIQQYLTSDGVGGSRSRTGQMATGTVLPRGYRGIMAFPISILADPISSLKQMTEEIAEFRRKTPQGLALPDGVSDTFLLDSGNAQQPGGTGKPFDWISAAAIAEDIRKTGVKLIVAGGLMPGNVADAIRILHPWGVDVASGVESSPGKKDPQKVRAFVQAVREADRMAS